MTNDNKENLLNYITGNLSIESPTDEVIFSNEEITQSDYFQKNQEYLTEKGYTNWDFGGIISADDIPGYIIYNTVSYNSHFYSYLVILNEQFNVVNIIDTYDSGTQIRLFETLEFDENNNLYGIDFDSGYNDRVVLLNNPLTSTNNQLKLRSSYYLPSGYKLTVNSLNEDRIIKKVIGEATYIINIRTTDDDVGLLFFKIVVGGTNEWNFYKLGTPTDYFMIDDYLPSYSNNTIIVDLVAACTVSQSGAIYTIRYDTIHFDGENYNVLYSNTITSTNYPQFARMTNITTYYLSYVASSPSNPRIVKVSSGTMSTIASNYGGKLIVIKNYIAVIGSYLSMAYTGIIYNDVLYKTTSSLSYNDAAISIVSSDFLLYRNIVVSDSGYVYTTKYIIHNEINGNSYVDYNSMIAKYGKLYDENNNLIFARNLYNNTLYNNQTVSTVQIPANFLNNNVIGTEDLISKTNTAMISNVDTIEKNKYENVLLNFINTINVIDEDTETSYPNSSTYINNNINIGTSTNYGNTKLTKIRLNTSTPTIQTISWVQIDDTHYYTSFSLNVSENIPTIDFISNDETTTYITINTSSMEIGKAYTITQYLRIE